jgi:hypothetical protein
MVAAASTPTTASGSSSESEGEDPGRTGMADAAQGPTTSPSGRKSQDAFRINFLRKLSYEKVWVPSPQRPPKYQTVTIFDWDDTLLCTTFLQRLQDEAVPEVLDGMLRKIACRAASLLELAMRLGRAFIITNAISGWVEYTAATWIPELLPVLRKVKVISARSKYEPEYPGDVNQWKTQAFLEVQRELDNEIITNLISVGDSNVEMHAAQVMGEEFSQAVIKTVKFCERPGPEELVKQLDVVLKKFEPIVQVARDLKIGLRKTYTVDGKQAKAEVVKQYQR